MRLIVRVALLGGALLLSTCTAAFAAQRHPDFKGVWVGIARSGDARFATKPYAPTPEFTPWGAAESGRLGSDSHTDCGLTNPVQFMDSRGLFPMQILDGGSQIVILNESMVQARRIYLDGRKHPVDAEPTWLGHSIGHWESDTLVVDTVGLNGRERPLNDYVVPGPTARVTGEPRLPTSERLHLVERLRMTHGGQVLEHQVTIDDSKTYAHPFAFTEYFQRRPDIDLGEFECGKSPGSE